MLKEILNVRQIPDEPRRRWFTSSHMDLVVWLDIDDEPLELQLCYDKGRAERAFTWKPDMGFLHTAVDDGEGADGRYKATPILVADGDFDWRRVGGLFLDSSKHLPANIARFVTEKIQAFGTSGDESRQTRGQPPPEPRDRRSANR